MARSWHMPVYHDTLLGADPLRDGPRVREPALAIARIVLRTNARIAPVDALHLSSWAVEAAEQNGLPPEFLAATLLQESAFDPQAISWAGAAGIAQFMPDTAAGVGVEPFDPFASIDGCAQLLAQYVKTYASRPNPYALALAAYNAGAGAVAAYNGVPPYAETKAYIADIFDRWAAIVGQEQL